MSSANAPADIQTPEILTAVLRDLLASVEKPSLDPPLAESDLDAQKFHLVKPTATAPEEYYRTALETAHKNILYEIAVSMASPKSTAHPLIRWCR